MKLVESIEFIYCECGCGKTRSKYKIEKDGKIRLDEPRMYINHHSMRGKKHSEETRKKMCEVRKGKYVGENHYRYGKHLSDEIRMKISKSRKGKCSGKDHHLFGKINPNFRGEKNPNWVGNDFKTIEGIHYRIRTQLPMPLMCEICGVCSPQELSNKDHKYSLKLEDWQWLCIRCHRDYDDNYIKNFKKVNDARKLEKEKRLKATKLLHKRRS